MAAPQLFSATTGPEWSGRDATTGRVIFGRDAAWKLLTILGVFFIGVGTLDLALAWLPLGFGSPEWEFGTLSATLNVLPVPIIGIGFTLAGSLGRGASQFVRLVAGCALLLALLLLACAFLYATVLPLAFSNVQDPIVAQSLRKAALKSGVLLALYPSLLVMLALVSWRNAKR